MAKKGSQLTVRTATEIQGGEFVILGYAGRSYQMTLDELKKFIGIIEADGGSVDLTQVSTDILPLADASKDIGSLEKRWKKVYSTALTVKAQSVDEEEVNIHDGGIEGILGRDIQWSIDGSGNAVFLSLKVNGADVATMQYVNNELSKYVTTDTLTKNYVSNTSLTEILKKYYESGYVDFLLSSKASTGDLNKTNTQLGLVRADVDTLLSYFQDTDDVDDIINKWRELEAFLAGQTETSTLADLLSVKADKETVVAINSRVTDLEDSDFVDIDSLRSALESYYTKKEVDALLGEGGNVDLTGYVNEIAASGTGNGIASVSKDGGKLTFNKATFLTDATIPAARTTLYGGIKIGYKDNGKNYGVLLDDSGKAYVNVPWESYDLSKFLETTGGAVNYLQVSPAKASDSETINIGVTANEISGTHGNGTVDWKINSSGAWIGTNQLATQSWADGKFQTQITGTNKLSYSLISGTPTLATVATSGNYNDLSNKPTIPDVSGYVKDGGSINSLGITSINTTTIRTQGDYIRQSGSSEVWKLSTYGSGNNPIFSKPLYVQDGTSYNLLATQSWANSNFHKLTTVDTTPTSSSTNLITSGGVFKMVADLDTTISSNFLLKTTAASTYLPLSGGTIKSTVEQALTLYRNEPAGGIGIKFEGEGQNGWVGYIPSSYGVYLYTNNHYLYLTKDGVAKLDANTLIHSGNIGSQSVAKANVLARHITITADTIDSFLDISGVKMCNLSSYTAAGWGSGDGMIISIPWENLRYGAQIAIDDESNYVAMRAKKAGTWLDWRPFAFLDSTVSASKKLVTSQGTDAITVDDAAHVYLSGNLTVGGTVTIGDSRLFTEADFTSINATLNSKANSSEVIPWSATYNFTTKVNPNVPATPVSNRWYLVVKAAENSNALMVNVPWTNTTYDSLKNPYSLTFGSKTYDGSSAKTITASDLGAVTSSSLESTLTDYVKTNVLNDYLPLSGGTLTRSLSIDNSSTDIYFRVNQSKTSKACFGWESGVGAYLYNYSSYHYLGISDEGTPFYKTSSGINTLIHSGNYSDYALPLSGGTISGDLRLKQYLRINAWEGYGTGSCDAWYNGNNGTLYMSASNIRLGSSSSIVIHSGNIGSYAVTSTTLNDFPRLNGTSPSGASATGTWGIDISGSAAKLDSNTLMSQISDWNSGFSSSIFRSSEDAVPNSPNGDFTYGIHLRFHRDTNTYYTDIVTDLYNDVLSYRRHTEHGFGSWKTIAFTDSTVAAANKLVTSDSKSIIYDSGKTFYIGDTLYTTRTTDILGKSINLRYGEGAAHGLILNASGNVTIGDSDLAGTNIKLRVNGNAAFGTGSAGGCDVYFTRNSTNYLHAGTSTSDSNAGFAFTVGGIDSNIAFWLLSDKTAVFEGNVGIGTTDPQDKLHVNGNGIFNGCLNITGVTNYAEGIRIHAFGGVSSLWFGAVNNTGYDAGMWGITANAGGNLRFRGGSSSVSDLMNITQSGNVGIGTTNPNTKLHVVGGSKIEGALSTYGITATTTAATDAAFTHYVGSTKLWWVSSYNNCANFHTALYVQSGSTPFKVATENDLASYLPKAGGEMADGSRISCGKNMYIGRADNVGWVGLQDICSQTSLGDGVWSIRTSGVAYFQSIHEGGTLLSSKYLLQSGGTISGSLTFSSTSGSHIIGNSNSEIIFQPSNDTGSANIPLRIAKTGSSTFTMYCDESEVYDLGTSSYKWNILYCRSASQSSDATLKNILGNVALTTSQIANAPAVNFTWKNGGAKDVGTIAQYWKDVLPEVVSGEEGSYGMNYAVLGVVSSIILARNIETHEQRIARLEKEKTEMKAEAVALKAEIVALKAVIENLKQSA